jgi:predicted O-methyltransferase YrrM
MTDYFKEQMEHKPTREMYKTIYKIAKKQNYKNAMEVGIAWAISTIAILSAGTGKLLSIDKSNYSNTEVQVDAFNFRDRWSFIESPSEDELPKLIQLGNKYDLICIDGYHKYEWVKRDLENAAKLITEDGVIIVDDYYHKYNFDKTKDDYGVNKAVNEIVKENNFKLKIYKKANGIAEIRRSL